MALVIPNFEDSPTFDGQAVMDKTDLAAWLAGSQGTGVILGMTVSPHTGSDMAVNVAFGVVSVQFLRTNVLAVTNIPIAAASSTDRRDIVIWTPGIGIETSGSGTSNSAACEGTPCGTAGWTHNSPPSANPPVKPTIPSGSVLIGEVYVAYNTTAVASTNLVDKTTAATLVNGLAIANGVQAPSFSSGSYPTEWLLPDSTAILQLNSAGNSVGWSSNVINITDPTYGAIGDNSTDNTLALQQAIIDAASSGWGPSNSNTYLQGGVVRIPPGVYLVGGVANTLVQNNAGHGDGRVVLLPGVILVGDGEGQSIIKLSGGAVGDGTNADMLVTGNVDSGGNVYNTFSSYLGHNPSSTTATVTGGSADASGVTLTLNFASGGMSASAVGQFLQITGTVAGTLFGGGTDPTWATNVNGMWRVTGLTSTSVTFVIDTPVGANSTWHSGGKIAQVPGTLNWGLERLTIDGNQNQQTATTAYSIRSYGANFTIRDCTAHNGYSGDIFSSWTTDQGTFGWVGPTAGIYTFKSFNCAGTGIDWDGPHDAHWSDVIVDNASIYGHLVGFGGNGTANGLLMQNCHFFGCGTGNSGGNGYIGTNAVQVMAVNCEWESGTGTGTTSAFQLVVDSNDVAITGGSMFSGHNAGNGILIGHTQGVTGVTITNLKVSDANQTLVHAIDFSASDPGGNNIQLVVDSISSNNLVATNQPNASTRFHAIGNINGNQNIGPQATALLPGGVATPVSGTLYHNFSGVDTFMTITNSGGTSPAVTGLTINSQVYADTNINLPPTSGATPALSWGPFLVPSQASIKVTYTGGSTWTWAARGIG